jgi:hypothetical protein
MSDNFQNFSTVAGLIFAQLQRSFPTPVDLDEVELAKSLGREIGEEEVSLPWENELVAELGEIAPGEDFRKFVWNACIWLRDEGFIRADGSRAATRMVLTTKALSALNATPVALEGTLGSKLTTAANQASTEAGRSAIAETVGQLIGAAVKYMAH